MKVGYLFAVVLVVAAYAEANCGCLKCSKHLYVASPPGAPVKIIYRTEPGTVIGGGCTGQTLPVSVQAPMQMPQVAPCGVSGRVQGYRIDQVQFMPNYAPTYTMPCTQQRTYDYRVQAPVKLPSADQVCIPKPIKGRATVDRIVLPAPVIQCSDQVSQYGNTCGQTTQIKPIKTPVIETLMPTYTSCEYRLRYVPLISSTKKLDNLQIFRKEKDENVDLGLNELSSLDLRSDAFYQFSKDGQYLRSKRSISEHSEPSDSISVSKDVESSNEIDRSPLEITENIKSENYNDTKSESDKIKTSKVQEIKLDSKDTTKIRDTSASEESQAKSATPNSRKKRHIPLISTGVNFLMNLLPPFIKNPIQQGLREASRDFNQRLRQQNRNRVLQQRYADREARKMNPYVGLHNNYRLPHYHPYSVPPPSLHRAYSRRPFHDVDENYAEDLEDNFLSSLAYPTYTPQMYMRQREEEPRRVSEGYKPKGYRENAIAKKYGKKEMSPQERQNFLKKLQKLNGRSLRNRRSLDYGNEDDKKQFFRVARQDEDEFKKKDENPVKSRRSKRALILDGSELGLPFFRVTKHVDNEIEDSETDSEEYYQEYDSNQDSSQYFFEAGSSEEFVREPTLKRKRVRHKEGYLDPLDADHIIPHNPIYYFLNTPIRFLHYFDNFRKQLSPVLKSVPQVLINSKTYLKNFGKNFERGILDFASNFVGDFEDEPYRYNTWNNIVRPRRFRRSVQALEDTKEEKLEGEKVAPDVDADRKNILSGEKRRNQGFKLENFIPKLDESLERSNIDKRVLSFSEEKEEYKKSEINLRTSIEDSKVRGEFSEVSGELSKSRKKRDTLERVQGAINSKMVGSYSPDYELVFGKPPRDDTNVDRRLHSEEVNIFSGNQMSNGSFTLDDEVKRISEKEQTPSMNIKREKEENGITSNKKEVQASKNVATFDENKHIFVSQEDSDYLEDEYNLSRDLDENERNEDYKTDNSDPGRVLGKKPIYFGNLHPEYEKVFDIDDASGSNELSLNTTEKYRSSIQNMPSRNQESLRESSKSIISGDFRPEYTIVFGKQSGEEDVTEEEDSTTEQYSLEHNEESIDSKKDDLKRIQINNNSDMKGDFNSEKSKISEAENSEVGEIHDFKDATNNENPRTITDQRENSNIQRIPGHVRKKRYLLQMVNDGDVEEFLREKLTRLVSPYFEEPKPKPQKKKCRNCERDTYEIPNKSSKQRYVIEKLYPKIIIDNNGMPFVELDGVKRPMFFNKKKHHKQESSEEEIIYKKTKRGCKDCGEEKSDPSYSSEEINLESRISNLIDEAKKHAEKVESSPNTYYSEMPVKTIKERISQLLKETQDLITMDFEPYFTIYTELFRLEHLKNTICEEWKQMVMQDRINDINCKIRLLDDFKKLQLAKDEALQTIAEVLKCDNNDFMTKKLIKMLIRLQKLQCIIFKVVEDAEEKLTSDANFDIQREIKYIDYLCELKFVTSKSRNDLEEDLKKERDQAVERDMYQVEKLRELLECQDDSYIINDEARLLWEIKNMEKLQKDAIDSLNSKIKHKQKIRKELKILFDLQKQIEQNEEKQKDLLKKMKTQYKKKAYGYEYYSPQNEKYYQNMMKQAELKNKQNSRRSAYHDEIVGRRQKKHKRGYSGGESRHQTIIEDKSPVKIFSNGYTLTGYKMPDVFG